MSIWQKDDDERFMRLAIEEARKAADLGEVPVGAVIVKDGEVVSAGHNTRETEKSALGHAEITAIQNACRALNGWRLQDCVLYVTLEPCSMCAGAILNARIRRVVFGADDEKAGCCKSVINLFDCGFPFRPAVTSGVLQEECNRLLADFFASLRGNADR